jgi:hypothetical protein
MTQAVLRPGLLVALLVAIFVGVGEAGAQMGATEAVDPHANLAADPHAGLGSGGRVSDVPEGPASILGQVVHRTRPEAEAGIRVALFALGSDGRAGIRRTTTASDGRFTFEKISNDPGTVYLLGLRYADLPFGARVVFAAGQLESRTAIEIADTSHDTTGLALGASRLRVDRGCTGVRVTESHDLTNDSDFVLYVPPAERASAEPLFRTPLPAGASFFEANQVLSEEGLEQRGDDVFFYGPLYPGKGTVEFGYSMLADGGTVTVERRFPAGAEKTTVLTWEGSPKARGAGFEPAPAVAVGSLTYDAVENGPIAPGESVSFAVDVGASSANASRLSLAELQVWLELDDAALDVREQYTVAVSGDAPLESDSDAPLLCLPLPAGAEDLRFSADSFSMGIQPDASAGIALRGPFPAGESEFALSYLLPNGENGARFEQHFPTELSLLTMYIADTGVLTKTDRLHRRRPVETPDRTFLHLEGFQIAAGETVSVDLSSLPAKQPISTFVRIGFVGVASILAIFFLVTPLRQSIGRQPAAISTAGADERAAVYAAIRDLEDDFETGKISAEDRGEMLSELRARAAALLRAERAASTASTDDPAAPAPATACRSCGAPLAAAAHFCSECGEPIAPSPEA